MYIDRQTLFSDKQAVTATAVSSDAYDLGATTPIRSAGRGTDLRAFFTVNTTATAAGAATVVFELIEADNAALTTNVTVLAASAAIPVANLTAGAVPFDVVLPGNTRRFIGARYTVATGPLTAGQVTAGLVLDSDFQRFYASGYFNAA